MTPWAASSAVGSYRMSLLVVEVDSKLLSGARSNSLGAASQISLALSCRSALSGVLKSSSWVEVVVDPSV